MRRNPGRVRGVTSANRILLPALLAGLLAVLLLHVRPFSPQESYVLEVELSASMEGRARLYFDRGNGFVDYDSSAALVQRGAQTIRFALPECTVARLRLWPLDRVGSVSIERAEIVGPGGVERIPVPGVQQDRAAAAFEVKPGWGPEYVFSPPVKLAGKGDFRAMRAAGDFALYFAGVALVMILAALVPDGAKTVLVRWAGAVRRGFEKVPHLVLLLSAVGATAMSCYPVVFAGRSFVSPGNGVLLLYDDVPTLPGAPPPPGEDARGSDTGALMWAHVPYSVIEHRAVFHDKELPLWNRYNYCGVPLLGQGMSMLGDPLHWLPITHAGAPWAWDLKFLLAKVFFSLGVGLCVRAVTGRLWLAVMLSISASFLGFFSYRFNHPAFFAMCYSPWILHAWIRAAGTKGRVWPWALAVALANFWQMNTGVMKESAMLIAGLNFTGFLMVMDSREGNRLRKVGAMLWGFGLFVLLSAPCWLVFLDALKHSWTPYDTPKAFQIQPALALGLFDDLFYRQFTQWENHFNPSANFLILLGCGWAVANVRTLWAERAFAPLFVGALISGAFVFGVIPAAVITRVPFLANIEHIDNTFSVVLIAHLIPLAGFGLRAMWDASRTPRMAGDWLAAMAVIGGLFALYYGSAQAIQRGMAVTGAPMRVSEVFAWYCAGLAGVLLALPWVVRSIRVGPGLGTVMLAALGLFILHFHHGMWTGTQFDYYVMNPQRRAELAIRSPGLEHVRAAIAASGEPSRVAGYRRALVPGFNGVLGFEHFAGADALVGREQRELAELIGTPPMWGWRWQLGTEGAGSVSLSLCNLWGVRWLVAMPCDAPDGVPTGDLALMENPDAWPRAFFTNRVVQCNSLANFVELLPGRGPFAAVTPVKPKDSAPARAGDLEGALHKAATGYRLTANTTAFEIEASEPGVAVLTETYQQGNWIVKLDGRRVEPFRVNHAFMGVEIPTAGRHSLHFEYWPRVMNAALWLGLAGGILLLLTPLLARLYVGAPNQR